MFLFRSLFWLTAAFLVIAPQADLRESAAQAPWAALSATQAAVAAYAPHMACDSFECVAARSLLTAATQAPARPVAPLEQRDPVALDGDGLVALIAQQTPETVSMAIAAPVPLPRPGHLL